MNGALHWQTRWDIVTPSDCLSLYDAGGSPAKLIDFAAIPAAVTHPNQGGELTIYWNLRQ